MRESYLGDDRDGEGGELAVIGTEEESDYRWCISEVLFARFYN